MSANTTDHKEELYGKDFKLKELFRPTKNYGDCIVFIEDKTAIIFDCGSEDHAKRAIALLDYHGIEKATVVLSHNDDDHFKGIPFLIEKQRVDKLFTILLLKYKDRILDEIDDGRRNRDSIARRITELYDNIASLSGKVTLCDVYEQENEFPSQMKRVGPSLEYMIQAAAKGLDSREGDQLDNETFTNAASMQIQLTHSSKKILLTGDCAPAAISEDVDLNEFDYIQLPHHGKPSLAEEIFQRTNKNNNIVFLVSDNTGNTNGGSDDLKRAGHQIKDTKQGDITINDGSTSFPYTGRTLGL